MNWLVCNRCCKRMGSSKRSWSLTQCGHIYCNICVGQMGNTCPQCDTVDFSLMPLTNPPRVDANINYFTKLDEIVELCSRAINFQENQMMIAVHAAQYMESKYAKIREGSRKVRKKLAVITSLCKKLQIHIKNAHRARGSQSHSARRVSGNNNAHSMDCDEEQKTPFEPVSSKRPPSTNGTISSASTVTYRDSVRSSQTSDYEKRQKNQPNYPYNPNPQFSKPDYRSGETSDSGCSTIGRSPGKRVEGFLVPSISRVPKSAATAKRKTPTGVRLTMSVPTTRYEF